MRFCLIPLAFLLTTVLPGSAFAENTRDIEAAEFTKKRVTMCDDATANIASFDRTLQFCSNLITVIEKAGFNQTPEQRGIRMVSIAKIRSNIARIELRRSDASALSRARGCEIILQAATDFSALDDPFTGFPEFNKMGIEASSRLQEDALKCRDNLYSKVNAQFGGALQPAVAELTKPCTGDFSGEPIDRMSRCNDAIGKVVEIYTKKVTMLPADINHYAETLTHLSAAMLKISDQLGTFEADGCKFLSNAQKVDAVFVQPINSSTNAVRTGYKRIFGEYESRCKAIE